MTTVFRDGDYQSVAEKTHPPRVPGHETWTALRFVDNLNSYALDVVRPGVAQDFDFAVRIAPSPVRNLVWVRVQRYPVVPGDNGTHWVGPIRTVPGEATYIAPGSRIDRQNAKAGHGYGVDIKAREACIVDQLVMKLDPRGGG